MLFTFLFYQLVKRHEKHLTKATEARSYLKSQVEGAKEDIQATFETIPPLGSCIPACTNNNPSQSTAAWAYILFDTKEVWHFWCVLRGCTPAGKLVYTLIILKFFTPCMTFTFIAQVNYLIDEGMNIGKGANCIISLLHHYLQHHRNPPSSARR